MSFAVTAIATTERSTIARRLSTKIVVIVFIYVKEEEEEEEDGVTTTVKSTPLRQ